MTQPLCIFPSPQYRMRNFRKRRKGLKFNELKLKKKTNNKTYLNFNGTYLTITIKFTLNLKNKKTKPEFL